VSDAHSSSGRGFSDRARRDKFRRLLLRVAATESSVAETMDRLAARGGEQEARRRDLARRAREEADRFTDRALRL
jgi:hypothetical protein